MKKETKEFCEIATIRSGKFNPLNTNEIRKCIELEHISQETGTLLGYVNSNNQKSIKNVFQKGDVLFGKLRPYLKKYILADFDGVCSSEIWVLKPQKGIDSSYLFQLIQTNEFIQIANVSCGSKMPRADWNYIKDQTFEVASSSEQTKIANFLTAVDKKIAGLENQIALQEQYKSGMMQKIFSQEIRFKDEIGENYPEWEEKTLGDIGTFQTSSVDKLSISDEKKSLWLII